MNNANTWGMALRWPWDAGLRLRADVLRFTFGATPRERTNELTVRRIFGACNWRD